MKFLNFEGLSYLWSKIQALLGLKAPIDSPALTGKPTAPTAESGTVTTQIATTEFVQDAVDKAFAMSTSVNATDITLFAANWVDNTQTVDSVYINTNGVIFITPNPETGDAYVASNVNATSYTENSITFVCDTTPTVDLSVKVLVMAETDAESLRGKNCTIESITPVEGGNNVVFAWTDNDGVVQRQTLFVANGAASEIDAEHMAAVVDSDTGVHGLKYNGESKSFEVHDAENDTWNAAEISAVDSAKLGGQEPSYYAAATAIPTAVSTLTNDAGYQTADQVNTTVTTAVANAGHLKRAIVDVLPDVASGDVHTIYMVPIADAEGDNKYTEWMLINGAWEKTGDSEVDLSGYMKTEDMVAVSNTEIDEILAS